MKLFVYGSLMSGMHNSNFFLDSAKGEPLPAYTMSRRYRMYDLGSFPGVIKTEHNNTYIKGEVVELDSLKATDFLEGHPTFYKREIVGVVLDTTKIKEITLNAWMYIYQCHNFEVAELPEVVHGNWRAYVHDIETYDRTG